ncbi:zinc-dependent alcohol dehydrogenase, partial [Salinispira pacifica]
ETALVIGQGVIGLLVAELLLRCGAEQVLTTDPIPRRRELSAQIGCTAIDPGSTDCCEHIRTATQGRGPDITINTSGSSSGLQLAIDVTAFEGLILEASWYGTRSVQLDLGASFHRKRLTIRSSQVSRIGPHLSSRWSKERRLDRALRYAGEIRPSRLISHRIPLSAAASAFELIADHPEEVLQVVLDPSK